MIQSEILDIMNVISEGSRCVIYSADDCIKCCFTSLKFYMYVDLANQFQEKLI